LDFILWFLSLVCMRFGAVRLRKTVQIWYYLATRPGFACVQCWNYRVSLIYYKCYIYINLPLKPLYRLKKPYQNPLGSFKDLGVHRDRQRDATLFYITYMIGFQMVFIIRHGRGVIPIKKHHVIPFLINLTRWWKKQTSLEDCGNTKVK
jgi:hypothetical protein